MATWNDIGIENLEAAKLLKEQDKVRSCLNRAYYSVYAIATARLQDTGVDTSHRGRPNPGHDQLHDLVRNNLQPRRLSDHDRKELARRFRHLMRFRQSADYDPESTLESQDAVFCLQQASQFHQRLEG